MRVAIVMDPLIPVPPKHYGGIERVIDDLTHEYTRRGIDVTLFAGPGSRCPGRLRTFGRPGDRSRSARVEAWLEIVPKLRREGRHCDVVHNFGRLAYLTALLGSEVVKVQTYMRPVTARNIAMAVKLLNAPLQFTAVSDFIMRGGAEGGGNWTTVYNCADVAKFSFNPAVDPNTAPVVFLARLERCKGLHSAIAAAKEASRRLVIAGNTSDLDFERQYFEREIRPLIDHEQIQFIGPVDDPQKVALLQSAAALLLPIEWDEPFPVVLPEALLCGTPIIGFRRGGIPEGIRDGITGFLCDTVEQMARCIGRLAEIQRSECRRDAELRFSVAAVAEGYLDVYRKVDGKQLVKRYG